MPDSQPNKTREAVISALKTVFDPEIPLNIYELGLIYNLDVDDAGLVDIRMTLTSPACPVAGILVEQAQSKVQDLDGVSGVQVELVWDPPWSPDRMSEAAKLTLNLDPGEPRPSGGGTEFIGINKPA